MEPWKEIYVGDKASIHRNTARPGEKDKLYGARAIQHVGQSQWVTVVVAGEKTRSKLAIKGAAKSTDPKKSTTTHGNWPAQDHIQKDIVFFETSSALAEIADSTGEASAIEIANLKKFGDLAPDWEEYGYRQMLALIRKMPPSVYQHALSISICSESREGHDGRAEQKEASNVQETHQTSEEPPIPPRKLKLHQIYAAIKAWVEEQNRSAVDALHCDQNDEKNESEESLLKRVHALLADQGHGTKVVEGGSDEGGGEREWVFAIKKMGYKMSIGLVSTEVPLCQDWFHPLYKDKVWYWQCCSSTENSISRHSSSSSSSGSPWGSNSHFKWHSEQEGRGGRLVPAPSTSNTKGFFGGFIANGAQIHMQTEKCFQAGSYIAVRLDANTGKVSFWLRDTDRMILMGCMEGINGVVGQVYPAVCLGVNGDCVEFAPDPIPHADDSVGGNGSHKKDTGGKEAAELLMQTDYIMNEDPRPYHYAHLSTASHIERLLDDAQEILVPYQSWPSISSTGWLGNVGSADLPVLALGGAKRMLREARAILDGNAAKAMLQVKIINLPTDTQHQEIKDLVLEKCGFTPVTLSLKLDRDFLHPSDRARLSSSMYNENMTAFLTVSNARHQKQALNLNGQSFRGHLIHVNTVARADAKTLPEDGEKIVTIVHRILSLEHDMRACMARLQTDTASSLDAVFAHIAKGDGSQAVAALERAREAITRLPPGELLAHEQAHLENDMMDIQEKIGRLEAVGRKQLEDECVRLERDLELRLEKTRSFLEARGERKDSMSKELRQKRHELESENLLLLKEFARENSLKLGKLRKVYTEIGSLDLGKRLAQAEAEVRAQYPWLNFYKVEDMLGRMDWLLDSAEYSLRHIERGRDEYIAAWECVTSARYILTLPMGHDDRRKLGLDTDKAIAAVQVSSLTNHWHPILRAFPERGKLVHSYDILIARLASVERLLQSLMRPMREQVYTWTRQAQQQVASLLSPGPRHVIEAARSLRAALHMQARLPKELAPDILEEVAKDVNTETLREIARAHSAFKHAASEVQAKIAKPLKDIYISFDFGPPPEILKNSKGYPNGGSDGRHTKSEVYYQQKTDAQGWAVLDRVKRALTSQGWKVHTGDYPYDRVYDEAELSNRDKTGTFDVGDFVEALGMRLCISGKLASSGSLPEQLAHMCRERLEKVNAERAAEGEALSSVDSKVYVEDTRFKVVSSKYELDTDTSFFDMIIKPTQTILDRCTVETLASTLFSASEDNAPLKHAINTEKSADVQPSLNKLTGCFWPWPLPKMASDKTGYGIQSSQQIQESWAVLMLVTKRYLRACTDLEFVSQSSNSKAISEMRNAVWFKGPNRIVVLLVDDLNDLGVPFTWRGRMGDMLRDCVWFDGSPRSLDSSMPKLQKHFTNIMGMAYDPPSKPTTIMPVTAISLNLEPCGPPTPHLKPVAGGSTVLLSQERRSDFVEALRSLPAPHAAPTVDGKDSTIKARNKKASAVDTPAASVSSALKLAQSFQVPKGFEPKVVDHGHTDLDLKRIKKTMDKLEMRTIDRGLEMDKRDAIWEEQEAEAKAAAQAAAREEKIKGFDQEMSRQLDIVKESFQKLESVEEEITKLMNEETIDDSRLKELQSVADEYKSELELKKATLSELEAEIDALRSGSPGPPPFSEGEGDS